MQSQLVSNPPDIGDNPEIPDNETWALELRDFDSLVKRYRPRIFRFLLASLRDREAAESLTQDCFVRAWRAREQFRGAATVSTWRLQIAANLAHNHQGSGRLKFWRRALRTNVDMADLRDWVPDRHGSPEELALAKEQVEAVWTAVAGLSEKQRTVFLLRFVEELDLLEIAAITGMKEGTVKTHLFRAVQSVRTRVEERK
jgi:RNA polymerase sigma-70 factor, ECF subfamily